MQKKTLVLSVVYLLLISIMMGGCTSMQSEATSKKEIYPNRPISIIVGYSVGATTDILARMLEKTSSQQLGQPLVTLNKPGGTGTVAWNELASAKPDGYTLGITSVEVLLHPLYGSAKYNYPTALEPLAQIASSPFVLAVQAKQPWQDVKELIAYAKQHPQQLKFGHGGIGAPAHLVGEQLKQMADIKMEQVPFLGASDALVALLGEHVQLIIVTPAMVKEQIKAGKVRALAVSSEQRLVDNPVLANIPTLKEQGFDIVLNSWFGVSVPKEVPPEIKDQLAQGLKAMITDPQFKSNVESLGLQYDYLGPQESQAKWLSDKKKLSQIVQDTGILALIKAQRAD